MRRRFKRYALLVVPSVVVVGVLLVWMTAGWRLLSHPRPLAGRLGIVSMNCRVRLRTASPEMVAQSLDGVLRNTRGEEISRRLAVVAEGIEVLDDTQKREMTELLGGMLLESPDVGYALWMCGAAPRRLSLAVLTDAVAHARSHVRNATIAYLCTNTDKYSPGELNEVMAAAFDRAYPDDLSALADILVAAPNLRATESLSERIDDIRRLTDAPYERVRQCAMGFMYRTGAADPDEDDEIE